MDARRMAKPPLSAGFLDNVFTWKIITKPFRTLASTPESVTEGAHSLRHRVKETQWQSFASLNWSYNLRPRPWQSENRPHRFR